eukprot:9282161-Pyramimonas_sp.AAC.1
MVGLWARRSKKKVEPRSRAGRVGGRHPPPPAAADSIHATARGGAPSGDAARVAPRGGRGRPAGEATGAHGAAGAGAGLTLHKLHARVVNPCIITPPAAALRGDSKGGADNTEVDNTGKQPVSRCRRCVRSASLCRRALSAWSVAAAASSAATKAAAEGLRATAAAAMAVEAAGRAQGGR